MANKVKQRDELKEAIEQALIFASRRMVVIEQLSGKSQDYQAGFFDGIEHETDFMIALLSPTIIGMKETLDRALKARGIEP